MPGKSHGWRSLVGYSPWGREESNTTKGLHFHFPLSCIGERNGNPLQCSWLENPRDGRAWWAAVYGVAQSRTRLKRLSSSSSSRAFIYTYMKAHLVLLRICLHCSSLAFLTSVESDSSQPHGLQPTRVLHPWDFPGKSTGVGCHSLLRKKLTSYL